MVYNVQYKVRHNGKSYEPGDSIKDLKKEEAEPLLQLKAIVEGSPEKPKEKMKEVKTDPPKEVKAEPLKEKKEPTKITKVKKLVPNK